MPNPETDAQQPAPERGPEEDVFTVPGLQEILRVQMLEREALTVRFLKMSDAATELLEVADLRGDSTLPHPADDSIQWTARMQTAWDELRAVLDGMK